jgi:hypothetical protein
VVQGKVDHWLTHLALFVVTEDVGFVIVVETFDGGLLTEPQTEPVRSAIIEVEVPFYRAAPTGKVIVAFLVLVFLLPSYEPGLITVFDVIGPFRAVVIEEAAVPLECRVFAC